MWAGVAVPGSKVGAAPAVWRSHRIYAPGQEEGAHSCYGALLSSAAAVCVHTGKRRLLRLGQSAAAAQLDAAPASHTELH